MNAGMDKQVGWATELQTAAAAVVMAALLSGCGYLTRSESQPKVRRTDVIAVTEMHCANCVGTIRAGLRDVPGVVGSKFDLEKRTVEVTVEDNKADRAAVEEAIRKAGFKVGAE